MEQNTKPRLIEKGNWAWSNKYQEPVLVLETQELWSHQTSNVWVPSRDIVTCLHNEPATQAGLAPAFFILAHCPWPERFP